MNAVMLTKDSVPATQYVDIKAETTAEGHGQLASSGRVMMSPVRLPLLRMRNMLHGGCRVRGTSCHGCRVSKEQL